MMRNYFGCNKCSHFFMKGWHRESDNKILKSAKTPEQRKSMKWWVGNDELEAVEKALEEDRLEVWCDECKAFVSSLMALGELK